MSYVLACRTLILIIHLHNVFTVDGFGNITVLKIMDAGYCLYVHIFMKNIISLKPN